MHPSLCLSTADAPSWYHSPTPLSLLPIYYPSPTPSHQQIDSSIGPNRVSRRQPSLKQGLLVRRVSLSLNVSQSPDAPLDSPLTDTQIVSPHVPSLQSHTYHPNTPSSMSSPYPPFDNIRRSRTRSASHFEGRSHSPALSTTSGVTNSSHTLDNSTSPDSILTPRPIVKEKHRKHRLRDADRKHICLYHLDNPNARQEDIGAYFNVERSTISKILKEKDRWLNISEEDECDPTTKHRPSKFPEVEEQMIDSLQEWSDGGVSITDQLIRQRALSIAKSFHIAPDKFKGSSGWVENFKHRHDIRRGEWLRANKMLPPDYTINEHETPASTIPPNSVLMTYDQRVHMQPSESQPHNCLLKPSGSHQDLHQDLQHVHARLSATPAHWPEEMHNDVPQSPHPTSALIDPALQAQGPLSPLDSDHHPLSHTHQDIQHSPEVQHHQPHHHQQHHNQQQHLPHHTHSQQHAVIYSPYGQPLRGPGVSPLSPTIDEAEAAVNLLITFVETNGRGIIKDDERRKLTDIKCALFQAANGLTYERPAV